VFYPPDLETIFIQLVPNALSLVLDRNLPFEQQKRKKKKKKEKKNHPKISI